MQHIYLSQIYTNCTNFYKQKTVVICGKKEVQIREINPQKFEETFGKVLFLPISI